MEIVIDIPEKIYKYIQLIGSVNMLDTQQIANAIFDGKPLPKGHGRLIDADKLRSMYSINQANFNTVVGIQKWIDDAPTIIKKDKEQEE